MNWETLLFLGDSITNGARSYLSFPEYAGNFLQVKTDKLWNIINLSENGITTIDLLRLTSRNYSSLQSENPALTIILIGTNDAKKNTAEKEFTIAYNQLIIKAKLLSQNKQVLLVKIPLLQKGIMLPYETEMNKNITGYNLIIDQLAAIHKCPVLEMKYSETDFYDGVHLNTEGAESFGTQLSEFILNKRGL